MSGPADDDSEEESRNTQSIPRNKRLKTGHLQMCADRKLIVVLERCQLETVKTGKGFALGSMEKHESVFRKAKRTEDGFPRPDITHQCLLMLQDSVLNRAGMLQVFLHTDKNVLIEVNPQTRIPRTFDRFAGLMVSLLQKGKIRAEANNQKLLRVIKNPVNDHLPVGCRKISTSVTAKKVAIASLVPTSGPIVFVIGAHAHGPVETDYTEETVSFSDYPLSAAWAIAKVCEAFEQGWKVEK